MMKIRHADERGKVNLGWLDGRHTFSFGHYYDPEHMGFRSLRVMNEDRIAKDGGFPMHAHANMEIITFLLDGALAHRDSMGNGSVLQPGMFQRMSAGTGVEHSEFNAGDDPAHLYQIWILPEREGLQPSYEEFQPGAGATRNRLLAVAGPADSGAAMHIHQDAILYLGQLDANKTLTHSIDSKRHAWLQIVAGAVDVSGNSLTAGDGLALGDVPEVSINALEDSQMLLFDLA